MAVSGIFRISTSSDYTEFDPFWCLFIGTTPSDDRMGCIPRYINGGLNAGELQEGYLWFGEVVFFLAF